MNCQTCGACCASFRVDFHIAELAGGAFAWGEGVPPAMTLPVTATLVRMQGTEGSLGVAPRCVALDGTLGEQVTCSIYPVRPGPCREFEAGSDACIGARRRFGIGEI